MNNVDTGFTFKRGLHLKNRLVVAPMTTKMSFFDGVVTNDEIEYYGLRSGEVGAFITAAANVHENGKGWDGELGVYEDRFIPGLAKLAAAIKKNQTKAILQIFHAGRMTDSNILHGSQPVAPSAVAAERPDAQTPRELTETEILEIIESFKQATERAIKAGFDGVEIHGANTYLIQQFFSPHSNRRTDEWGGTLEKRFKFINDLVDGVTEVVDRSDVKDFIVGYRFSPEEYEEPGIRLQDTLFLVDQLANKPLDYVHLSIGNYRNHSVSEAYQEKPIIAYIKETINDRLPLIGVGDIRNGADAKEVLATADLAAVGRAILIDPHWAQKVLDDQDHLIRTELSHYDRDELRISNGVWGFLEGMMPERLQ
ncbi:NADH-dependent flavin oxidoreductase [Enterococcus plantarum]|uniref:NADH-dependent flavin oxidoreductase n=1 Tax=Enterococcus TaxID=1350 RepID=UPI00084D131F|nr:NADH-dependent flavin oxidoreductase [Enterococcus plantarum]MBO0423163.1 NADH-dependent flavin oxidoreductase [Enterococcus plantarum]OEG11200.1 NADH-dependent flavin oxidoreductase [Enterococcus plantarum]